MDETVKPGDDFFRHVNGKWLATHEIPADRPKDGGLYTLRDNAEKHVRELVEKIAKEQPESRIGALYNSFMDVEKIEADGLEPLLKEIAPILNSATPSHLAVTLAPVSYTHLDVYKRQIEKNTLRHPLMSRTANRYSASCRRIHAPSRCVSIG